MSAFSPKSTAVLVAEREVLSTLTSILEDAGHKDATVIKSTVRVLAKGVLECCYTVPAADGTRTVATAEICCVARKVLHEEGGMPA